jgi:receptor protein-tyrosine kinase
MSELMQEISARYKDRIVIFDSPPLLLTTEASVLAQNMGQIILVVEAEFTQNKDVKSSLSILSNEIVLLLLNKQREKTSNTGYGYGYGYGQRTGREG